MDRPTLAAYEHAAEAFATDWHAQPAPTDLHVVVRRFFRPGLTADIGCGSGREVAWLCAQNFPAIGYDASEALLGEARGRYPGLSFRSAALPELKGVPESEFDNVLCETVIMHLPADLIPASARALMSILKPDGILYLSWRVTEGADQRDQHGRLYSAFSKAYVVDALASASVLLDEEVTSASSGKKIHRIVARKGSGIA
jgi:2-polyprenyl-3-methyl-5-hydroxy-6-metoxy-1,4-benzoquinol methylase